MAYINLNEIDKSIYSLSNTSSDDVVYIPGPAITGPSDEPVLCGSYKEFINIFGDHAPSNENANVSIGTAWDYAANILLAGFPVLFQRVDVKGADGKSLAVKASAKFDIGIAETPGISAQIVEDETSNATVSGDNSGTTPATIGTTITPAVTITVEELFGGTFGNSLSCEIMKNNIGIYFRLYRTLESSGGTKYAKQLENIKLVSYNGNDPSEATKLLVDTLVGGYDTKYVKLTADVGDNGLSNVGEWGTSARVSLKGGSDISDLEITKAIPTLYELSDKYLYNIKFITGGGYFNTVYEEGDDTKTIDIATSMVNLADTRKDCLAILDAPIGVEKEFMGTFFDGGTAEGSVSIDSSYATAYAPWQYMTLATKESKWMPPSFVFLYTLAKSIASGNKIWSPPAGVRRATVPSIIEPEYEIGSAILDEWQNNNPQYINPIMKIRSYGYVIYGQRTLYKNVDGTTSKRSALQELGVRLIANEIKREITRIAISLTFQPNNIRTWNEFRGKLDPYLKQIQADDGLVDYEIIMDDTTTSNSDIDANTIRGIVRANISRAAENFEIDFELTSSSVTFSDEGDEVVI